MNEQNLSHEELIQEGILIALEDLSKAIAKQEHDALIMMYIETDMLDD